MPAFPPDPMGQLDASARSAVRAAGLAAAIAAAIVLLFAGAAPRQALDDLFQRVLPAPPPSGRVHVVVLDAESLRDVQGWPWSRAYLARLTDAIASRGARAIGFGMLLPEPDRFDPGGFARFYPELGSNAAAEVAALPSMDRLFAEAIRTRRVVLARAGVRAGSFDFLDASPAPPPPEAEFSGPTPANLLEFPRAITNLPAIDAAAAGHGLINGDRDPDGLLRRTPLVARVEGRLTPGFALELARVGAGSDAVALDGRDGRLTAVRVGQRRTPTTPDGQLLLRFADWRRIPTISAVDLLRRGAPPRLFEGQIVLVGLTAAGVSEVVGTPRDQAAPGVFIQAEAVDALLRGGALWRPGWAAPLEWGLGLILALAAWLAAPRLPIAWVAIGGALGACGAFAAAAAAFQAGLLLDPFPVAALGAAASGAMVVVLYAEGRRAQARLRAQLGEERRRAIERQRLLINELNHRVKNTLATVQSMAMQTLRGDRPAGEAREAFLARLMALSAAHNLLTTEGWEGAELTDVVRTAIGPFDDPPGARFVIGGPSARLNAPRALGLALALQELGSNALKFGALSVPRGRVELTWGATANGDIAMLWREAGGPPASAPGKPGFGTRLVRDALSRELGGRVHLEHGPAGLSCEIVFRPDSYGLGAALSPGRAEGQASQRAAAG